MPDPVPFFDPTLNAENRLLATFAVLAALAVVVGLSRRLVGAGRERFDSPVVDAVVGLGVLSATGAAGYLLVTIWETNREVANAISTVGEPGTVLTRVVVTVLLFATVYVVTQVVHRAVERFAESTQELSRHQAEVAYRVTQVVSYAFSVIVVLGLWSVDLSGLLIGAGFLGIVVGMAARQTLGAMLAGFVLMFSRPFEIGDWVEIGNNEGIVTDITIVNTRLQTPDGEYVMVPNDVVSSNEVVNRSRKGRLRLEVEVGVDYATDVEYAREAAREAVSDLDGVLSVPQPQVVGKRFADSAVVLGVRFWIDKPSARRKWRARTAVVGALKAAFDAEGVKIPFPQRELSGRAETGGFRVGGDAAPEEAVEDRAEASGDADD